MKALIQMSAELEVSFATVIGLCLSASHRYKEFAIPKRSGGTRIIHHPARKIKILQRWAASNLLGNMPIHDSAYAYVTGRSVRQCVEQHIGSSYFLKMDFRNFFPSVDIGAVVTILGRSSEYSRTDLDHNETVLFASLLTRFGELPIGSPASPAITNIYMFGFDEKMIRVCAERGLVYTRYADDLTVSGQDRSALNDIPAFVSDILKKYDRGGMMLNEGKTRFLSFAGRVSLLGLNITPQGQISIGRDLKRQLRAGIHNARLGRAAPAEMATLSGYLNYVNTVEPSLLSRFERHFGKEFLTHLRLAN